MRDEWNVVRLGDEDWVDFTLKASEDVCAEVVDWADEVLRSHQEVGEEEAKDDGANPGANEA